MATLFQRFVQVLDRVTPPRQHSVVCHSSPDLDDMIIALLLTAPDDCAITVLADDAGTARQRMRDLDLPPVPVLAKSGARGLVAYLRAEHSISTHGLFGSLRRGSRKRSSTPWHGELSKQIGALIGRPGKYFDMTAVSSLQSKFLRSTEFQLAPQHTHVIGTPRQSTLVDSPRAAKLAAAKGYERWVLFVPTYRKSAHSAVDIDNALSIEFQEQALVELDRAVRASGGVLWVRPHPVADPYTDLPSSIRSATDDSLQAHGLSFYDVLGSCDVLVTDYSSVWVDFLLADKPVVGFCPDIEEYRTARGLALEPYDAWFPGPVLTTSEELCRQVGSALDGNDDYREKRAWVRTLICPERADPARAYWSVLLDR